MSAQPIPRAYGGESYREKATRKFKENPWVPIGAAATTVALLVAMVKMRRGESRSFNHWLRARVVAQGLTIVAIVAGSYTIERQNTDANKTQLEVNATRKVERERMEFEERLKAAEASHGAEVGIHVKGGKGREEGPFAEPKGGGAGVGAMAKKPGSGGLWGLRWGWQSGSSSQSGSNPGPNTGAIGESAGNTSQGSHSNKRQ